MLLFLAFIALFLILWAVYYAAMPAIRTVIAFAGRLGMTRFARVQAYAPVVAIVVAGAFLTVWAGNGFIDLAEGVHERSSGLQRVDQSVHDWAVHERRTGATLFFVTMTNAGGPYGDAVLVVVVAIALAVTRRWRWLIYLGVTAGGGALLDEGLKLYFARARPDVAEMLRRANGYSFPSGHAMEATVVFGALAYLALRAVPTWSGKAAALAFANVMIVSVALSRVYLGVHWVSDVGAGITAGAVWVAATTSAYETLRRVRMLRQRADETSALRGE